jgi:large subunit ribosomal protein L15
VGSGLGKTAGRGQKGQKARSTGQMGRLWFQGGQTPLARRLPKRGFRNPFPLAVAEVNVGALEAFDAGSTVGEAELRVMGFVKGQADKVKILGNGELTKKLTIRAHAFSKGALAKIEAVGGSAIVLEAEKPAEAKAQA